MKKLLLTLGLSSFILAVNGQLLINDSTNMSASYINQAFYSLDNGEVINVDNNNWSIAFSVSGNGAAGSAILLNEATSSLWAYPGDTTNWNTFDTTGYKTTWKRLLNSDTTWTNGAFNAFRGAAGTFDMGWGILNPSNNYWTFGDSLYLIKLSDNSFRKLKINSLKTGVWEFKYENLDGSSPQLITIAKATYPNRNFVYHSLITNLTIDREPINTSWDLTFVKNIDFIPVPPSTTPTVYSSVSSVFSNKLVWSAKANLIDSTTASTSTTPNTEYNQKINNIGREWKKFSAGAWTVYDSISYFVFDNDSTHLYRVVFTKFGGSTTGKSFFNKQKLASVGIVESNGNQITMGLYPNPTTENLTVVIKSASLKNTEIEIVDINGKVIKKEEITLNSGVNQIVLNTNEFANGFYQISIKTDGINLSQRFIKQ